MLFGRRVSQFNFVVAPRYNKPSEFGKNKLHETLRCVSFVTDLTLEIDNNETYYYEKERRDEKCKWTVYLNGNCMSNTNWNSCMLFFGRAHIYAARTFTSQSLLNPYARTVARFFVQMDRTSHRIPEQQSKHLDEINKKRRRRPERTPPHTCMDSLVFFALARSAHSFRCISRYITSTTETRQF